MMSGKNISKKRPARSHWWNERDEANALANGRETSNLNPGSQGSQIHLKLSKNEQERLQR